MHPAVIHRGIITVLCGLRYYYIIKEFGLSQMKKLGGTVSDSVTRVNDSARLESRLLVTRTRLESC